MINIFQYLYDKKGKPIPLEIKLINQTPLNENDLIINNDLDLEYSTIKSLPDNLTVNGNLFLFNSKIQYLPNNLTVNGHLSLKLTNISSLPDNLIVNSNLYIHFTPLANKIKEVPELLTKFQKQIKGTIYYA